MAAGFERTEEHETGIFARGVLYKVEARAVNVAHGGLCRVGRRMAASNGRQGHCG
jgi:hypothetical protein